MLLKEGLIMRKLIGRIIAVAVCGAFIFAVGGCKTEDETKNNSGNGKEDSQSTESSVTLGNYIGIEYTPSAVSEVTDKQIEEAVQEKLASYAKTNEITDRAVKEGDTVNIDYVGKVDGKEFSGGSFEGYDLTIGSGKFIDGFEDGLIGAKKGETRDVEVTFPEVSKNSPELAGKDAVFTVKVNSITETVYPELTDDFAKENLGYDTAKEYKNYLKDELEKQAQENAETTDKNNILNAVVENSKVDAYPEAYVNQIIEDYNNYYLSLAEAYGYNSLEDFVSDNDVSLDTLNTNIKNQAYNLVGYNLIMEKIADEEGLQVTKEDLEEAKKEYLLGWGYDSQEEFEKDKQASFDEYYRTNISWYDGYTLELELKVKAAEDFIIKNAKAQ